MVKRAMGYQLCVLGWGLFTLGSSLLAQTQSDYYRIETYELPKGVNFEASGLAVTAEGGLAKRRGVDRGEGWLPALRERSA